MDPRTPLPPRRRLAGAAAQVRRAVLRRRRLLAAGLAAIAVAAALQAVAPPAPARTVVPVAARDLPAGTRLSAADLTTVDLPPGGTPDRLATDPVGHTLAAPVTRGEPITEPRLVGPHLTDAAPGETAVPIRISDPAQVTLLSVGDRIDLLATDPQRATTTPLAHDIEVLAVPPADAGTTSGSLTGRLVVVAVPTAAVEQITTAGVVAFVTYAWPNG